MAPTGDMTGRKFEWRRPTAVHAVLGMLVAAVLLQVELVFAKSINWDEFFHFSTIHRHLQGRPVQWLQVPFVWLFSWVPSLPGDNISHIQLIRLLLLPFELATIAAIAASARQFASREAALICSLVYVTGGYVFLHAFALRADMIAACLLTVALWIGICRPLRVGEMIAMFLLVMLAFISTIKSVLYAPAFLGMMLYRMRSSSQRWALAGAVAALAAATAGLLWLAPALPDSGPGAILRDIGELGRNSLERMFSADLFPQGRWLFREILMAPLLSGAVVLACICISRSNRPPAERVLLLLLLLPLCTAAFYRNAFPYYFVFILPPAMIAIGPAIDLVLRRYGVVAVGVALLANAAALSLLEDRQVLPRQRVVQKGLHEIFPAPVTYIDDCGMLGDFPRAINRYTSGWALAHYRARGVPTYSMAMGAELVPLLLADGGLLGDVCFDFLYRGVLLPEDHRTIRENYVQHWGNAFVAGKKIAPGDGDLTFQIAVPGPYTIEKGPMVIDGIAYPEGGVAGLSRGPHVVSGNRATMLTLRWGDHLALPNYPWPTGALFTEF